MQALLEQIHANPKAILLGTQMLAKGHHFPHVTLVGMVDADSGLFSADFRAVEQMGQLLFKFQVALVVLIKTGTVYIQTRHPDHPLLQTLIHDGYQPFARALLQEREQAILPPYSYFAVFRAEAYGEQRAQHFLDKIKSLPHTQQSHVTILGPVPALLAKRKGLHCHHLLIKSNKRAVLQQFLKDILHHLESLPSKQTVKWTLDVDPLEVV